MTTSTATLRVLTELEAMALALVAERLVPGSTSIGSVDYVDRVANTMPAAELRAIRAAISMLAGTVDDDETFARQSQTPAFAWIRGLVIEAYYGDYAIAGHTGETGHEAIDFHPPQAERLRKDWSFLDEWPPR